MAREAKQARVDEVEYVVEIENNREDPDPFVVSIEPMTAGEVKLLERSMGDMTGHAPNFVDRTQKAVRDVFGKRVKKVRNYSIAHKKTGEVLKPLSGVQLYNVIMEHGDETEATIIDDIFKAIQNQSHLRAGLPEVLRSQSASQSSGTLSTDGDAAAAGALNPPRSTSMNP